VGVAVLALLTIGISYWLLTRKPQTPNPNIAGSAPPGMISIPGGEFMMGRDDGNDYEKPAHKVFVKPFYIDETEVTNAQYQEFVDTIHRQPPPHWTNGRAPSGKASDPVYNVSWDDASAYAQWAGKRLPTEEEWEYAARGTDGRLYPYGNTADLQYSNAREDNFSEPLAVRSYPSGASPFGVFDMAGNVSEWTADSFKLYPGSTLPSDNPNAGRKVVRGGAYNLPVKDQTATDRFFQIPSTKNKFIGFRCAQDVK